MTKNIVISTIKMDETTQSRVGIDEETVNSYAQDIENGAEFLPITVFHDGEHYWLADGFHRIHAARLAGGDVVEANIMEGDIRDAVLHSVGANATNGLRRTNSDKRRSVEMLLVDEEWAKWSDSEISKRCGVAPNTVKTYREKLSMQNAKIAKSTTRTVTRNGKTYQQKISNIGKKKRSKKKSATRISRDAPRKGDGPDYLSYQAKVFLKEIDLSDPNGAEHLKRIRDWINELLRSWDA